MPGVQTDGIEVHYVERGWGPALVWVPGIGENAAMALQSHERLLDRYRMVVVDPRGQGGTTAFVVAASYAPSLLPDDLLAVLNELGLERPVLGGHARGARAALEFARAYPERVRAVVALAPAVQGGDDERLRDLYPKAAARVRREGLERFISVLPGAPKNPLRRAEWEGHVRAAGPEALAAQYDALARLRPLTEGVEALTMPVLLVYGAVDRLLPEGEQLVQALPNARLVTVPDAGHLPFHENKEPYFAAVEGFLREIAGADGQEIR